MSQLEHRLEREILICARRSTVFRFFTDSGRFAAWWGPGSKIVPEPGGQVLIRHPNGIVASGEVVSIEPESRIVFTYGYEPPGEPSPPGSSRVTITLSEQEDGTHLHLLHELPDASSRDHHIQGWRFQLSLFASVAAADQHQALAAVADRFFACWSQPDAAARRATLEEIAIEDVRFQDAYSCLDGRDELDAHMEASLRFRPGMTIERAGEPVQCQGVALVPWLVKGGDGKEPARGRNVVHLTPDGRLARVVGLWGG